MSIYIKHVSHVILKLTVLRVAINRIFVVHGCLAVLRVFHNKCFDHTFLFFVGGKIINKGQHLCVSIRISHQRVMLERDFFVVEYHTSYAVLHLFLAVVKDEGPSVVKPFPDKSSSLINVAIDKTDLY